MSKRRTNISIFIPHAGCRHKCSFCDQKTISGSSKAPEAAEVFELLRTQAPHLEERGMSAEIAFFGGSFTAIERGKRVRIESYKQLMKFLNDDLCVSLELTSRKTK